MNDTNTSNSHQAEQDPWGRLRVPDWKKWEIKRSARLWQAVALLCEIAPEPVESGFFPGTLETLFREIPEGLANTLDSAKSGISSGKLKAIKLDADNLANSEVDLTTFATWAQAIGYRLPVGFPWQPEMQLSITGWPWGRHETDLLRKLAHAADKFWKNFDPSDPTTAPTNKQVSEWLIGQGVSSHIAGVMATILRADGLPTRSKK